MRKRPERIRSVERCLDASPAAAHRALTELNDAGILGRSRDQRGKTICWTAAC